MRVGMILDSAFPPDYRVEKEAITLSAHGHDVILFCLDYTKPQWAETYKGFKVVHYPSTKFEYKLSALAYTFPFYHALMKPKLNKFFDEHRPEVLHVHDMVIAEAAFSVASAHKVPVVLDLHENRPVSMSEYRHLHKFPGNVLINLDTWAKKQIELVKRADRIVAVTQLAVQDLVQDSMKNPDNFAVVPNTSSENFANETLQQDLLDRMNKTFNILYIGDTSIRRGTADAIKSLPILVKEIPNIRLYIVGNSSADAELVALTKSLGMDDYVSFEGWQPQKSFTTYITGSHICISPLRRNRHHDTTYANKVFQYMALGRSVVVSDCPAQAELVLRENCGLVHEAGNIESYTTAILKLYRDKNLRDLHGENAKNAVLMRWNWEITSKPLVALYASLTQR